MDLKLPLLGDVMTEGTLVAWLQPEGAVVARGQPLYQLETDKVSATVDAPENGVLQRLVAEGETVPVGTVVARLHEDGASAATGDEVRASPAARRLAERLGVDLAALGSGRRIREADVQAYHDARRAAPPPPAVGEGVAQEHPSDAGASLGTPLAGRRRVIAERMRASLAQTAQLTISMDVDMTEAVRFRAQLQQLLPETGQPTITDLVIRAAVLALAEHPALNATFEDGRLRLHPAVHVGLAVDAPEGLIVPVIRDAAALTLRALAEHTKALAQRARANQLGLDELQGGTFTVTSLGPLGVDFFTPIINPPQVAILGIGRLFSKVVLGAERPEERQALYLNLSFDHQVVDGAPAARFLQSVKRLLELPAGLVVA
jgi:pyruvate dehydrogenase E2 component (dihydrolipoamide acetyltransferase)